MPNNDKNSFEIDEAVFLPNNDKSPSRINEGDED